MQFNGISIGFRMETVNGPVLYVAIAPDCHPHDFVRPSRPGRIGGSDWAQW